MSAGSDPIQYMARSKAYYEAQGFDRAYRYAHHAEAPFAPLSKPLSEIRLGLVTTAATYARAPLEPRKVDSGSLSPAPERLFADDLSWDKKSTHLEDRETYLPLVALNELVAAGRLGAIADRFHCSPTEYSHRSTLEHDAPELHRRLLEDGVDAVLLVPL